MDTSDAGRQLEPTHDSWARRTAVPDTDLPGEVVAEPLGDENEAPAGEYQTATEAELEIAYANAAMNYRAAKAEHDRCRKELIIIVQALGSDKQDLITKSRLAEPALQRYEIPLPMNYAQIREFTGWSTAKVNNWLKYRQLKGAIKTKGKKGSYLYYYTDDPVGEYYYSKPRDK